MIFLRGTRSPAPVLQIVRLLCRFIMHCFIFENTPKNNWLLYVSLNADQYIMLPAHHSQISSAARSPQSTSSTPRSPVAKKSPRPKKPSREVRRAQRIRSINMQARFRPTISMMCDYQLDVEVNNKLWKQVQCCLHAGKHYWQNGWRNVLETK